MEINSHTIPTTPPFARWFCRRLTTYTVICAFTLSSIGKPRPTTVGAVGHQRMGLEHQRSLVYLFDCDDERNYRNY